MTVPQLNALNNYWKVIPPVDAMVAAYFGFGSSEPPPLPQSQPSAVPPPLIAQPQLSKSKLTHDKVMELQQLFPSGKITIN